MRGFIYSITNLVDGKRYIGKTLNKTKRFCFHRKKLEYNEHYNIFLQRAWNKYGKDAFLFEIIEEMEIDHSRNGLLDDREKYWIQFYRSNNEAYGYNLTDGGDGGQPAEEIRQKMSIAAKNRFRSQEERDKQRKRRQLYFEKNPCFKKQCISNITNPVYRQKAHAVVRQRLHTDKEYALRIVAPLKTDPKPINQLTLDGRFIRRFDSMAEAERWLGKKRAQANISSCCRGKRNFAYGYKWEYAN